MEITQTWLELKNLNKKEIINHMYKWKQVNNNIKVIIIINLTNKNNTNHNNLTK